MAQNMGEAAAAAERLKKDLEREAKAAQGETGAADAGEGVRARTHAQPEEFEEVRTKTVHTIIAWSRSFEGANREAKATITEKELRDVEGLKVLSSTHARTHNGESHGYIEVVYTYRDAQQCREVEKRLAERFIIARQGLAMLRGGSALLPVNALMPTGMVATLDRALKLYSERVDPTEPIADRRLYMVYEPDTRGMRKRVKQLKQTKAGPDNRRGAWETSAKSTCGQGPPRKRPGARATVGCGSRHGQTPERGAAGRMPSLKEWGGGTEDRAFFG